MVACVSSSPIPSPSAPRRVDTGTPPASSATSGATPGPRSSTCNSNPVAVDAGSQLDGSGRNIGSVVEQILQGFFQPTMAGDGHGIDNIGAQLHLRRRAQQAPFVYQPLQPLAQPDLLLLLCTGAAAELAQQALHACNLLLHQLQIGHGIAAGRA